MEDAICLMIAYISLMISLSVFSFETLKFKPKKHINYIAEHENRISIIICRKIWVLKKKNYPFSTTFSLVSMLKFHLSNTSEVMFEGRTEEMWEKKADFLIFLKGQKKSKENVLGCSI